MLLFELEDQLSVTPSNDSTALLVVLLSHAPWLETAAASTVLKQEDLYIGHCENSRCWRQRVFCF